MAYRYKKTAKVVTLKSIAVHCLYRSNKSPVIYRLLVYKFTIQFL